MRSGAIVVIGLFSAVSQLRAQNGGWVIPSSPAFTYLGMSPSKISQPSTPRDFATALSNGVDSSGHTKTGVAIELALWPLLTPLGGGFRVTSKGYQDSRSNFIWANTHLSIGSARVALDTASTDVAFGVKTNFINNADPLANRAATEKMDAAIQACVLDPANRASNNTLDSAKVESCTDTHVRKVVKDWLVQNWNAGSWAVAAAFDVRLEQSAFNQGRGHGGAVWTTVALPVANFGQLLGQARGDWTRGTGLNGASDTTSVTAGARLSFGGRTFNGFGELLGNWKQKGEKRTTNSSSLGVEFRAGDRLWLSTGFGSAYNSAVKGNRTVMLANIKWNVAEKSQFGR